jgi:DNA-binding transcriptional ArsR family regulator
MSDAPERLVQACGKHSKELDVVVRFDPAVSCYSHVIDGPAAMLYPLLKQIKSEFGSRSFTPKELYQETGYSRQTATRWLAKLRYTGALKVIKRGQYELDPVITKDV